MNKKMKTMIAAALMGGSAPFAAHAQTQLPNADFENWATTPDNVDSLVGWTSSSSVVLRPVIALYKDSAAYHGTFSARLVTAPFGFVQYSTIGILVNGSAQLSYGGGGGGANVEYVSGGGTPISVKPTELKFYYKYETLATNDQGLVKVLLTKYNTTSQRRDTVSIATATIPRTGAYTAMVLPLTDRMPGVTPDTITTIFYSSDPATVAPTRVFSDLNIDSITLYTPPVIPPPTSVGQAGKQVADIEVSPNPGTGLFLFRKEDEARDDVYISDGAGRTVLHLSMAGRGVYTADLRRHAAGIYYLSAGKGKLSTQKIVISR